MTNSKESKVQDRANDEQVQYQEFDIGAELEQEPEFNAKDYRFEDWIALAFFSILAITVFSQFFSRYVLQSSLGWTEEVARYLLVCVAFLGASMAVRKNSHIFVSIFTRLLPEAIASKLELVVSIFTSIFLLILIYFVYLIIPRIHIYEMASLPLPLSALYLCVGCALLMMFVRSVVRVFSLGKQ